MSECKCDTASCHCLERLEAENARLRDDLTESQRHRAEAWYLRDAVERERDRYKALAERLVEALKDARILCMNDHAYDNEHSQVFEAVQVMNRALADTSPAAAALLAQGERLRREVAWLETACANEDKSFDMFDVLERFRAALSGVDVRD